MSIDSNYQRLYEFTMCFIVDFYAKLFAIFSKIKSTNRLILSWSTRISNEKWTIFWSFVIIIIVFNIASIEQTDRMIERDITQTMKNSITFATLWTIIIEHISSSQIRSRSNRWSLYFSSSMNKNFQQIVVAFEEKSVRLVLEIV